MSRTMQYETCPLCGKRSTEAWNPCVGVIPLMRCEDGHPFHPLPDTGQKSLGGGHQKKPSTYAGPTEPVESPLLGEPGATARPTVPDSLFVEVPEDVLAERMALLGKP